MMIRFNTQKFDEAGDGTGGGSGGGGNSDTDAPDMSALLGELAEEPALRDYKTVKDLGQSLVEAQRLVGASVRIPGADAGEEALNDFYNSLTKVDGVMRLPASDDKDAMAAVYDKLGRPEAADKYTYEAPSLPDGFSYDQELETSFRSVAHQTGLSQGQFAQVMDWYNNEIQAPLLEQAAKAVSATTEELKTEWGGNFDRNTGIAKQVITKFGGADLAEEIERVGLGNSPRLAKMLFEIGKGTLEDSVIRGENGSTSLPTLTEMQGQVAELMGNPAYFDKAQDPRLHDSLVQRVTALNEQIYHAQQRRG